MSPKFDCFFLDIQMPDMDGLELAHYIRQDPRYEKTPIIAVTAHSDQNTRILATQAGFNHYIVKPADKNTLLETLSKL
jgi:CheY-like chemotaxis protein